MWLQAGNKKTRRRFPVYQHHQRPDCQSKITWNQESVLAKHKLWRDFFSKTLSTSHISCLHVVIKKKDLRRNPIENRAISGVSVQKICTRVILSILQSFLHFLKAITYRIIAWNNTENNFPRERKKLNTFQSSEILWKHMAKFHHPFHFTNTFKCSIGS